MLWFGHALNFICTATTKENSKSWKRHIIRKSWLLGQPAITSLHWADYTIWIREVSLAAVQDRVGPLVGPLVDFVTGHHKQLYPRTKSRFLEGGSLGLSCLFVFMLSILQGTKGECTGFFSKLHFVLTTPLRQTETKKEWLVQNHQWIWSLRWDLKLGLYTKGPNLLIISAILKFWESKVSTTAKWLTWEVWLITRRLWWEEGLITKWSPRKAITKCWEVANQHPSVFGAAVSTT